MAWRRTGESLYLNQSWPCSARHICGTRADSRFAPSQWETSHWLGTSLESVLHFMLIYISHVHSFHIFFLQSHNMYLYVPEKSEAPCPTAIALENVDIVCALQLARGLIKLEIYIVPAKTWHPIPTRLNKNKNKHHIKSMKVSLSCDDMIKK